MFNQKEYYKKWRLKNKKKMSDYMKKYRKKHPEYVEQENSKRRKGGEKMKCVICHKKAEFVGIVDKVSYFINKNGKKSKL